MGMICISDNQNFKTGAYIYDWEGVKIQSGPAHNVLGWHFLEKPTPDAQIEVLKRRFRERYWVLHHLKHNGFSNEDLVKVSRRPLTWRMLPALQSRESNIRSSILRPVRTSSGMLSRELGKGHEHCKN